MHQEALKIELMSDEALKTSEIEGEILNRDSIQSSIRRHFGLQTDHRRIPPAEQGIAEIMVDLYRNYQKPLNKDILFYWHKFLTNGRQDLVDIGRYRTHKDPMQVVSGPLWRSTIHFEAPPSTQVTDEMNHFISWFNETENQLPALTRTAIAHLHFECIHPFEDGNGRIGRAICEKSLSQSLGRPVLIALSLTLEEGKKAYYKALETYNRGLKINGWIEYFCETVLKAQDHTQKVITFIIEKDKFYSRFEGQFNERQQKVVKRMFSEGINGFKGGLSAKNYGAITGAPSATTTRDLSKMVEIGALMKTGALKSSRYYLNIKRIDLN